jgi:hypothetical protein
MPYLESSIGLRGHDSFFVESTRPFGSDFPRQNKVYLLYLPFALGFCGLLSWLLPGNNMFLLGSLIGGLAGLYALGDLLFGGAPLRFSTLLGMTLLLGYNLGAFNSWLTVPRAGLTIAEYFSRDPEALARGIGACMGSAAALFAIGELYERPVFGREFYLRFDRNSVIVVVMSTMLILGGFASGQLGYMGLANVEGHVNPLATLIIWWFAPAFAYSLCATLNTTGTTKFLLGACTVIQGIGLVPIGRRNVIYAVLLALVVTRLGRYRNRMSFSKKLLAAVLGIAFVFASSITFLYLRIAGYSQKGTTTLATRIALARNTLQTRSPGEIVALLGANASTRTFNIGFFSDLLDASQRSTPLLGEDMLENVQTVIPSVFYTSKLSGSLYGEEQLANMKWGFTYLDEANSILTAGAADFGIIGVFLYPLLVVLLMRMTLEWLQFVMPTAGAAMIALAFIFQMLISEGTPADYLLQIRNGLILAALFYLFSALPKFRWRSS